MGQAGKPNLRQSAEPLRILLEHFWEKHVAGGDYSVVRDRTHNSNEAVESELLGRLIDRHARALELYAGQWCRCPEDVLQEVLIELAACDRPPENPVTWLYSAVRYRAINASRAGRRRRHHETQAAQCRPAVLVPPPGETLDGEQLAAAVDSLPQKEREVVVARIWGELSFCEIGEVTGTSESTAHRRYQSGLARLREKVSPSCTSPTENMS